LRIRSHIPIKVDIGEDEELALGVKRLTFEEATKLRARWKEAENAPGETKQEVWGLLLLDCFRKYLRLECEVIIDCSDGEVPLKKAEELLDFLGARTGVLNDIFFSILAQSSMTGLQKKLSLLRTASSPSSDEQKMAPPGPKLETTATDAGNGDSAGSADATPQEPSPSGSTDGETTDPQSSSMSAPSSA
jgi:hypothetical protein